MDNFLETLKNLGPARLALMVVTFFGLIVFFIFIAARSSSPAMTLLYGNLSNSDSTEIVAKLDIASIPFRMNEDGTQVSVPQRDVGRARMLLAKEGLPHQGSMGYELFDQKKGFGTTSFEQNVTQLRALEGELSRTISTISQVRNARVHLVLPERELFSRETQPATASVFLNIRNAEAVGAEQISAIQHLVAAAVPQLKASRVAVIDQNGNLLARGDEESVNDPASPSNTEDMRTKFERRLGRSVEDMVGRIVGYGKVRATITADLNFDMLSRNSEAYNPEGQVVRSTQTISDQSNEGSSGANGGNVTVENNLPGLPNAGGAASGGAAGASSNRTEEVTNYEISKTVENLVRARGEVNKLSVAVIVDGTYEPDTSVQKPADAAADWAPPKKYVPRAQEQLDKITALVKSAVGYDESRGDTIEVVNMPFVETDMFDGLPLQNDMLFGFPKAEILDIAQTLALSVVAILIILLVLRPLATHFSNTQARSGGSGGMGGGMQPGGEMGYLPGQTPQPQLAAPGMAAAGMLSGGDMTADSMIDMNTVEGKVKASSVQKINELVTNHPNETISVIRQWMSTEG